MCALVERELFGRNEEVRARLRRAVLCRVWVTGRPGSERWRRLLEERFATTAIPLYVVLTPEDEVVEKISFPGGSLDPLARRFVEVLDRALGKARVR